jgi:small subunit ribosomal protein S6
LRSYELMMIHRPEMAEPDVRSHIGEVERVLNEAGEVRDTDFWGKRRFAYEIDHMNEGFYSVVTFDSETEVIDHIDRALSLSDYVVRHKIVRIPEGKRPAQAT